ncbi:hypothetical protein D3C72_814820 [compost metagenome]
MRALSSLPLSDRHTAPFDRVYRQVTQRIQARVQDMGPSPSSRWLADLVRAFQIERDKWNQSEELGPYRREWSRLDFKVTRLAAGAFLHIGYDLPRAMADEWPKGVYPDFLELDAEKAYQDLEPIFTRTFRDAARSPSIVGAFALLLGPLPGSMQVWFVHWVIRLRDAAWRNARVLATMDKRSEREAMLARAMTDAISTVSDLRLHRTGSLIAPYVNYAGPLAFLPALPWQADLLVMAGTAALTGGWLWSSIRTERMFALWTEMQLVSVLASLVHDLTERAVKDPDSYRSYAEDRMAEVYRLYGMSPRQAEAPRAP